MAPQQPHGLLHAAAHTLVATRRDWALFAAFMFAWRLFWCI